MPEGQSFRHWLSAGNVPVSVPAGDDGLDWEGQVAAYIGRRLVSAEEAEAAAVTAAYSSAPEA